MADMTPEQRFMFDYISESLSEIAKPFVGCLNTAEARETLAEEMNGFLDSLESGRFITLTIQTTDPVDIGKEDRG